MKKIDKLFLGDVFNVDLWMVIIVVLKFLEGLVKYDIVVDKIDID